MNPATPITDLGWCLRMIRQRDRCWICYAQRFCRHRLGIETFAAFRKVLSWRDNQPDKIICHQVGTTHQQTILNAIGMPPSRDFTTFQYLGNIGTVSLPITAAIADEREFLLPGDLVGFLGIGSGLNCLMLGMRW